MGQKIDEICNILKKQKEYINFRAISKEIKIIDKSKTLPYRNNIRKR